MGCNNSKDKKEPEGNTTAANPMNSPSTAAGNQQQASAFPEMKRDVNAPGPMNRKRSNAGAAGGRGKNVYGQKTEDIQGYVKPDIPAKSEVERSSLRATIAQVSPVCCAPPSFRCRLLPHTAQLRIMISVSQTHPRRGSQ